MRLLAGVNLDQWCLRLYWLRYMLKMYSPPTSLAKHDDNKGTRTRFVVVNTLKDFQMKSKIPPFRAFRVIL